MSDILDIQDDAPGLIRARLGAYWELTKPRICGLVLVVTAMGFYLALPASSDQSVLPLLIPAMLGTALAGAGANTLNQYMEADHDRRMVRTAGRPLPTGRVMPGEVLALGLVTSAAGVVCLALAVNALTSALAAISILSYTLLYTPLKRITPQCVYVGAVSGALPPVMGWTAASGSVGVGGLCLFAILFFWQLPHFVAIAWLYREDYARAGYRMLTTVDREGTRTNLHMITHTVTLLAASLLPFVYGLVGPRYVIGAMIFGLMFLACGAIFVVKKTQETGRMHLLASVIYLPLLFALMVADKVTSG